jgi:hypothetical protein
MVKGECEAAMEIFEKHRRMNIRVKRLETGDRRLEGKDFRLDAGDWRLDIIDWGLKDGGRKELLSIVWLLQN